MAEAERRQRSRRQQQMRVVKSRADNQVAASLFMVVTGASLVLYGGHTTSIDEETYLAGLRSFLNFQTGINTAVTPTEILVTTTGRGGQPTSIYGLGTTLFYLPMFLVGKLVSFLVAPEWREQTLRLFMFSTNSFALGLTAALVFLSARRLNCSLGASLGGSLALGVGSYALASAGTGFTEIITGMFLLLAFYLLITHKSSPGHKLLLSSLALGASILMRPSAIIFVPILGMNLLMTVDRNRLRAVVVFASGLILPMAMMFSYNFWKWEHPLRTGYPKLLYNTPWYEGIYGLFFSSGKGLVWFAPITVVALVFFRRSFEIHRADAASIWLIIIANALLFCRFEVWSGDDAFGPRYMTIVLPFVVLVAIMGASSINPKATWIAGFAGLPAALGGSLVYVNASNYSRVERILEFVGPNSRLPDGTYDWLRTRRAVNFTPQLSQLLEHVRSIPRAAVESWNSIGMHTSPFAVDTRESLSWYAARVRLDVWWLYWLESGAPLFILLLLAIPVTMIVVGMRGLLKEV